MDVLRSAAIIGLGALTLASCQQPSAEGQVVAVVNGEEITFPELAQEARARGLVIGNDQAARNRLLDEIIDRKLLVQAAVERKLDRSPTHLLAARRANELLLAQALSAPDGRADEPSPRQVAEFIRSNPWAFERRTLISVDRISFAEQRNAELNAALGASSSLDEVARLLAGAGITAERKTELWDSAQLPAGLADVLVANRGRRPSLLRTPGTLVAAQVTGLTPQPVSEAQSSDAARQWLRSQRQNARLARLVTDARADAQIELQEGFGTASAVGK